MSPVKEPNYFASEVRPERFSKEYRRRAQQAAEALRQRLDKPSPGVPWPEGIVCAPEDYAKLFRDAGEKRAIGEASVCYLWSPTAAANIHAAAPDAKIIMILRDPAGRALSQYLHNARDGVVRESFRRQIELSAGNKRMEFRPTYPFLENGLYYEQVKRFLDLFPRERVRIFIYEEAWRDSAKLVREIFEFLDVEPAFAVDRSRRDLAQQAPRSLAAHHLLSKSGVVPRLRKLMPASLRERARALFFKPAGSVVMHPGDRQFLRDYYRADVKKLAELLARDLRAWLD